MDPMIARHKGFLLFVGLLNLPFWRRVKWLDIMRIAADFDALLVGVGQAYYKGKDEYGPWGKAVLMEQFRVHFLMAARYAYEVRSSWAVEGGKGAWNLCKLPGVITIQIHRPL